MANLRFSRDESNANSAEPQRKASILKPEPGPLTDLTRHNIIIELDIQLDEYGDLWLKSSPGEKEILLDHIRHSSHPYSLLCFLAEKINNQDYNERAMKFKKKLKNWLKEFHTRSGI